MYLLFEKLNKIKETAIIQFCLLLSLRAVTTAY